MSPCMEKVPDRIPSSILQLNYVGQAILSAGVGMSIFYLDERKPVSTLYI